MPFPFYKALKTSYNKDKVIEGKVKTKKSFVLKYFWLLILIGLIVRLALSGTSSISNDNEVWYRFVLDLKRGLGPYGQFNFSYPPGLAALLSFLTIPQVLLMPIQKLSILYLPLYNQANDIVLFSIHITSPIFNFLQKLPLFLAEGLFLFLLKKYLSDKFLPEIEVKKLILFWWLNPFVIFVTAIHGQLDILPMLFVFIAVLLLKYNRYLLGGLMLSLAICLKVYPLFLLLPFLAVIFKSQNSGLILKNKLHSIFAFLLGVTIPLVIMGIYLLANPIAKRLVFARASTIGFEGSLNIGFINYIPWLQTFSHNFGPTIAASELYLMFLCLILLSVFILLKYQTKSYLWRDYGFEIATVVGLFIVYFLSPRTNPQYLIWVLPAVLILAAWKEVKINYYWYLSFAGLLFYLSIFYFVPGVFFYPFALYFGHVDLNSLNHYYVNISHQSGLINENLRGDGMLVSALIFVFAFLAMIWGLYRRSKEVE